MAQITVGASPQRTLVFDEVWGPVPKPRGLVALVAVTIGAITVIHMLILLRCARPKATPRRQ
jgi:hypothetical protein